MSAVSPLRQDPLSRARRRIQIALALIEDGFFDLLTPQEAVRILNLALSDLDEADDAQRVTGGIDWNKFPSIAGE